MSNLFYKYLSDRLLNYFNSTGVRTGDKYYFIAEKEEQVEELYETLKACDDIEPFIYTHEKGSTYESFLIPFGDTKLLVAATINGVTPDYLVTIRNLVGTKEDDWKNTVLLSLLNKNLDSVAGGGSNLQKEGMPLNVDEIKKGLEKEIQSSSLMKHDKIILSYYLEQNQDDYIQQSHTVFDFEDVLTLINKKELDKGDYNGLGFFYDNGLAEEDSRVVKKRLKENKELFEKVAYIHSYGNPDEELEKWFDDSGLKKLKADNWQETNYKDVKMSSDNNKKSKALQYIEAHKKETEEGLIFWERPDKDTVAGRRKHHIIIFNPNKLPIVTLSFKFDESLKKEYMKGDTANFTTVGGKQLKATIVHNAGKTTFKKVSYKHREEAKSSYEFRIMIVECVESLLESFKTDYSIKVTKDNSALELQTEDGILVFNKTLSGGNEILIEESKQEIKIDHQKTKVILSSDIEETNVVMKANIVDTELPLSVKFESRAITPVSGRFVWKTKREKQQHYVLTDDGKIVLGTSINVPKEEFRLNLEVEKQLVQNHVLYGTKHYEEVTSISLELPEEVLLYYGKLIQYYRKNNTLPSLAYMDEELAALSKNYIRSVINAIKEIKEDGYLSIEQKNLSKLGLLIEDNLLLLTPLHPLNVAYQLKLNEKIKEEELDLSILNRLRANNLLPYFIYENKLYKVIEQQHSFEWLSYGLYYSVSNDENKSFTEKLVKGKMKEFLNHFSYLFTHSKRSPLKVNLINLDSDLEFLQGVFGFMKHAIEKAKDENDVVPVEIVIYQKEEYTSSFELLSTYDDIEKIETHFDLSFSSSRVDKQDILRVFREKVSFSKQPYDQENYHYAHLSFFKIDYKDAISKSVMSDINTGVSLEGLLSGIPSVNQGGDYRSGFGSKYIEQQENDLLSFVQLYNELICNMDNSGSEPYRKGVSIVTRVSDITNDSLRTLYSASNWVTFIDPKVGLEFFKANEDNLIIIHYSDQYTSSSSYDSITVTNKTDQYQRVIEEFLGTHNIATNNIEQVISWFNVVNGEWLLKLIGNSTQFPREKLSIISAIKYGMSYLHHENILWVPISMEEVLRVSGAIGLNKDGGVFTAKNLNVQGQHSDDLLFIGVDFGENDVKVHYHPVEVKIGINQQGTINKATTQIQSTKQVLIDQTRRFDDEGKELFKNKFYRNFFMQLFLTNAEKLALYGLLDSANIERLNGVRHLLLNDKYEISYGLENVCGDCGIISFTRDTHFRTVKLDSGILKMDLTEQDALKGIIEKVEELTDRMIRKETDLSTDYMPYYHYQKTGYTPMSGSAAGSVAAETREIFENGRESVEAGDEEAASVPSAVPHEITDTDVTVADGKIEILFGTDIQKQEELYWKPTDTTLISNPNTGIIGTMGTGKTQFTKSVVAQLINNTHRNINGTKMGMLIFDYKGDYISDEFLSKVNGKKFDLYQLPYNPLSLFVGKKSLNLLPLHTARGITTTLEKAFSLGDVQSSILIDVIMEAYDKKGIIKNQPDTWTREAPTFSDVYRIFKKREDIKMDKLYKALRDINDFEIFEPDASKTVPLFELIEGITVINLQGYDEAIQNLVVAITLDLFYTQMQLTGDSAYSGNYRELKKFVLVDEADNFMSKDFDSIKKILKEGRSFGVGTILSTQLLSHFSTASNDYADYINSWIVHNVTDIKAKDVKYIFNTMTNEETENILQRIKQLEKHQSIVKLGTQKQPSLIRDKAFWELDLEHTLS